MTTAAHGIPGGGVMPDDLETVVTARGGAVKKGSVYAFTLIQYTSTSTDTGTMTGAYTPGAAGYVYANIVAPTATDLRAGRFCVALEDAADEGKVKVKVRGFVQAKVGDANNAAIAFGRELCVASAIGGSTQLSTGGHLDQRVTSGTGGVTRKIVAYALEAYAASDNPSLGTTLWVDFDGWNCMSAGELV